MLYPATLKVSVNNRSHTFTSPDAAAAFLTQDWVSEYRTECRIETLDGQYWYVKSLFSWVLLLTHQTHDMLFSYCFILVYCLQRGLTSQLFFTYVMLVYRVWSYVYVPLLNEGEI